MLAFSAFSAVCWVWREERLALVAVEMRYGARSELIPRISERILVLLRRIPRTVRTADMRALLTLLGPCGKEGLALVASPSDTLSRLLMDKILTSRLTRTCKNYLLRLVVIIWDNWCLLGHPLHQSSPPVAAGLLLGLRATGRVASALSAASMLALGAFLRRAEGSIARMAGAVDAHTDWLLNTQGMALSRMPFTGRDLESKLSTQFPGSFLLQLRSGNLFGARWSSKARGNDRLSRLADAFNNSSGGTSLGSNMLSFVPLQYCLHTREHLSEALLLWDRRSCLRR